MNMRHGMPPIIKMQSLAACEPSLSVDVECTMTADFFTQMRVAMNMQRELANQMILNQTGNSLDLDQANNWGLPPSAAGQSVANAIGKSASAPHNARRACVTPP